MRHDKVDTKNPTSQIKSNVSFGPNFDTCDGYEVNNWVPFLTY
jgi:hypothetical protein